MQHSLLASALRKLISSVLRQWNGKHSTKRMLTVTLNNIFVYDYLEYDGL